MDSTVGDQSIKNGYSSDGTFISINTQKVNSNTQLYKQAGNSIVVDVLEKILNNLLKGE